MKKTIEEHEKYTKVVAKAWADEEFKERLLVDPATVLKENGIEMPKGMTVKVVEQKKNEILIPLPPKPIGNCELEDKILEGIQGGIMSGLQMTPYPGTG